MAKVNYHAVHSKQEVKNAWGDVQAVINQHTPHHGVLSFMHIHTYT